LNRIADTWRLPDTDEPLLTRREVGRLCIPYGTLDPDERKQIEGHVTHTFQFLRAIPWTRDLARVPDLAYAHHEKLDGSGYPRQLRGLEIPLGARLMTIADIFDAVTAGDRPYKSGMRPDAAVAILRAEAQAGRLEAPAVELFAQKRLWEGVL
jgi:HD-GYP domain-containing protein (c-di-GMP phosphodiesterase class II)